MPNPAGNRLPGWLRLFLLVNVVEDAATGLSGLLLGNRILAPLHLTPLNGRFVGALYLAGGVGILLGAFCPRVRDARPILAGFLLIAVLVEALTLIYWSNFTRDGIPIIWLITYTVDPPVLVFALIRLRLWREQASQQNPAAHFLRSLAAIFGTSGIALLIATNGIVALWPWTLPSLVARLYASFFLALAVGALTAARQPGTTAARTILAATLTLPTLAILGSLFHLSRLQPGLAKAAWFTGGGLVAIVSATGLIHLTRRRPSTAAINAPTPPGRDQMTGRGHR